MPNPDATVAQLLVQQVHHRLFVESVPGILKCLDQLTEAEVWARANSNTVSVGNLVLHLCGNVRQWVIAGLGGGADNRQRQQEFDATGPLPTQTLIELLHTLQADVTACLNTLTPEALTQTYSVQGFEETGVSILVHVTEHFSYHTGQITYMVKHRKDIDLQYYGGLDLDKTAQ